MAFLFAILLLLVFVALNLNDPTERNVVVCLSEIVRDCCCCCCCFASTTPTWLRLLALAKWMDGWVDGLAFFFELLFVIARRGPHN